MNKFIYKVGKWLENPKSVSQEERDKNKEEAPFDVSYAGYSARTAAYAAADNDKESAIRFVNNYFEETNENKQDYLDAIEEEKVLTDTNKELSERVEVIARNGNDGEHYAELENNKSKYHREIKKGVFVDVYDVLSAFEVVNPAMQHALKKMLAPGKRGAKDTVQDMQEAIQSIERAIELEGE